MTSYPTDSAAKPAHEQIAIRAALLWNAKGNPQGQDDQIWFEAEQQLAHEIHENGGNSASGQSSLSSPPKLPASVAQEQMVEKNPPKLASKSASRKKSTGR